MTDRVILSDEGEGALDRVDVGLAAERTDLAWSRSGLSLMACGVVVAKGLPALAAIPAEPVAGAVILVLGAATWLLGLAAAHRRRHAPGDERATARLSDVLPVAVGTAAVGFAGLVLVLFQHG